MKAAWLIFRRDFSSYFVSPIAYVVLATFLVVTGIFFYSNVVWYYQASFSMFQNPYMTKSLNLTDDFIRPLFANIAVILLFLVPTLTMRSFSEEKRSRTLDLLLSYPVTDTQIVIGKFFAALVFFLLCLALTVSYPIFLFIVGSPEINTILSAYLGVFLMGAVFIAFGVFTSSTTENQIIASLMAFGLNLTLWIVGWISPSGEGLLSEVLKYLSMLEHFDPMTKGVLNSRDIVYFLSLCVLFLFFTDRVLISKKWRG